MKHVLFFALLMASPSFGDDESDAPKYYTPPAGIELDALAPPSSNEKKKSTQSTQDSAPSVDVPAQAIGRKKVPSKRKTDTSPLRIQTQEGTEETIFYQGVVRATDKRGISDYDLIIQPERFLFRSYAEPTKAVPFTALSGMTIGSDEQKGFTIPKEVPHRQDVATQAAQALITNQTIKISGSWGEITFFPERQAGFGTHPDLYAAPARNIAEPKAEKRSPRGLYLFDLEKKAGTHVVEQPLLPNRVYVVYAEEEGDWFYALSNVRGQLSKPLEVVRYLTVFPGEYLGAKFPKMRFQLNEEGNWVQTLLPEQHFYLVLAKPKKIKVVGWKKRMPKDLASTPE